MGETQNLRQTFTLKYDPLYGRFSRHIKTTDIPNLGAKSAPSATSTDWDMITYTTDANHALFPYIFTVHSTNTAAQFIMYNGETSTTLSLQVNDTENTTIVTSCDCPLTRIAPSSTLTVTVPGALINNLTDTYAAFVIAKREPIPSVVEN